MDIRIDKKYDAFLKEKAREKGFVDGDRPSVTALVQAIAVGEVPLGERQYLCNSPWLSTVQEKIENKQPFVLNYCDAEGTFRSFKAIYAELIWREKRMYLEIYDPEEGQDYQKSALSELQHNRCFRVDRIVDDAGISNLDLEWREEGFQTIKVSFDLFGGLAYSYSKKPGDVENWLEYDPLSGDKYDRARLRVTRKITSDFWFMRSIASYGENCQIVSPQALTERAIEKIKKLAQAYNICL